MVELNTQVILPETQKVNVGGRFCVDENLVKEATRDWVDKKFKPQTAVVKSLDVSSGQQVALKLYDVVNGATSDSEMRDNLAVVSRESFILKHLLHENIVSNFGLYVVETESRGKLLAMAMPWLEPIKPNKLTRDQKIEIVKSVAGALDYMHQEEVIHRDVRPDNIMLDQRGTPKLVDFDIALVGAFALQASWSRQISVACHPHYVAPELFSGDILPESDQYSLGRTAWKFLTGNVNTKVNPKPDYINDKTWGVIKKATDWYPEWRYGTCTEFAEALANSY